MSKCGAPALTGPELTFTGMLCNPVSSHISHLGCTCSRSKFQPGLHRRSNVTPAVSHASDTKRAEITVCATKEEFPSWLRTWDTLLYAPWRKHKSLNPRVIISLVRSHVRGVTVLSVLRDAVADFLRIDLHSQMHDGSNESGFYEGPVSSQEFSGGPGEKVNAVSSDSRLIVTGPWSEIEQTMWSLNWF